MIDINNLSHSSLNVPDNVLPFCEMVQAERDFIAKAIAHYKPENILEVGVSAGGGTVVILEALNEFPKSKVTSVDVSNHWMKDSTKSIAFIADLLYPDTTQWQLFAGKDFSEIAENFTEKFDFLLLDTAHLQPCEPLNFLTILPYLTENAIVILHDIGVYSRLVVPRCNYYACKLLYDTVTAEKCECFDYEYLLAHSLNKIMYFPNIGAFQINADTRKYIRDVFSMLRYPWGFQMPRLGAIQKILNKHYDEECMRMFKQAVAVNLSFLFCGYNYDFSSINNVFCEIEKNDIKVANSLRNFNRIIFHGAGRLCRSTLDLFEAFNLPLPVEIWDSNFDKASVDGYVIFAPNYEELSENDLVIVTIANYMTAHAVTANALTCRCANIFALHNLVEKLLVC